MSAFPFYSFHKIFKSNSSSEFLLFLLISPLLLPLSVLAAKKLASANLAMSSQVGNNDVSIEAAAESTSLLTLVAAEEADELTNRLVASSKRRRTEEKSAKVISESECASCCR